jgi:hypothetical protein
MPAMSKNIVMLFVSIGTLLYTYSVMGQEGEKFDVVFKSNGAFIDTGDVGKEMEPLAE